MPEEQILPIDITNYAWGRRAMMLDAPFIENPDGTRSTHKMAAERDQYGTWWVFPTIVQLDNGKLRQFDDHREALAWNINRGEAIPFGNDELDARNFAAGGYKRGTLLE